MLAYAGVLWPQIDISQTADSALSEFSIHGTTMTN
jgi:hypothetical protein